MASSPPNSPSAVSQRPASAMIRPPRSLSRMSLGSKHGGSAGGGAASGSRASDEDGKTSVKVAVRVRPPLNPSDPGFDLIPQRFQRSMVQVTTPTSVAVDSPQGRKLFVFDRVFAEDIHQEGVWDYLYESVNAFMQGYNVSLLAYGQSGSGKSYTMGTSGPAEQNDPKVMGVIPRAANALFEKLGAIPSTATNSASGLRTPTRFSVAAVPTLNKAAPKNWTMKATYIYNEHLRDLLLPDTVPAHERNTVQIREDTKGRILLTGLHQVTINSIEDLLSALNFGSSIRQTDATAINAKSSRSHAVFSINLVQRKSNGQPTSTREKRLSVPLEAMTGSESTITVDSKLHFVDLAGSERLKNTGAQGDRAKEGISINAGLASLGKVISQLSSRQAGSHVSYRDSKLTRLLQDSLGGNAITYMIACVTPAEFHLSETLNTVQYAQRARAIQSKPRIQQVADDGDKQALIDRLRAEVAFLREQIHNTERGDRRSNAPSERAERQNEKEVELQDRLLDVQENYTALSQRHARLISEIAQARDHEASQNSDSEDPSGESAVERLKRSNSFAEAVERVVSEYEKTIQSLETSLSSTRGSLSTTESSLLEKETKCAYIETVNQQLQARVQKLMDREASTEHYLHDLETKLDGHTSGEEKNSTIVVELRKEIARVRESEASCEDYISTLEERLAEADQDSELMQREIDRLEHVVERQRSLGKLDNLLYELDHINKDEPKTDDAQPLVNGDSRRAREHGHQETIAEETEGQVNGNNNNRESFGDSDNERGEHRTAIGSSLDEATDPKTLEIPSAIEAEKELSQQSPAQSKFVADKLESVTQELFDLRMDHETTVNEFDLLSSKYEDALRTLSELQDAVDEARHPSNRASFATPASTRPASFLGDARMNEHKDGGQLSSSRSLSSELFSAGESPTTTEASEFDHGMKRAEAGEGARSSREEALGAEVRSLRKLHVERDESMSALLSEYNQLQEQHQETLDVVEELKAEVKKAKFDRPASPNAHVIRRKSSQNVMTIDRAHRSFASLRNIASDNFEEHSDVMQSFEINLNAAMHELHSRSERVQELEADIATVKKEMEAKMTIITGLTRERTSLKNSSPMDISVVSSMRDQLMQSENQIRTLQESHAHKEGELLAQLEELRSTLGSHESFREATSESTAENLRQSEVHEQRIEELQTELSSWETRHQSVIDSMHSSEKQLLETVRQLEVSMADVEALRASERAEADAQARSREAELAAFEEERLKHTEAVEILQQEIDEHRATITSHVDRIVELEQSHAAVRGEVDETVRSREATEAELRSHRELIANLGKQIEDHRSAIQGHQNDLKSMHESHMAELEELHHSAQNEAEARLAEQSSQHQSNIDLLHAELTEAKDEMGRLLQGVATVLSEQTVADKLIERVQALVDYKTEAEARDASSKEESERTAAEIASLRTTVTELTNLNEGSVKEIERLNAQYKKSSRIVEELEEQLSSNFDQHVAANNRLSVLETERHQMLIEANNAKNQALQELEAAKEELARLGSKLYDTASSGSPTEGGRQRSNSASSHLRKSASVSALPSPPPAIPLPPLPTTSISSVLNGNSPTSNRPTSPSPSSPNNTHGNRENASTPTAATPTAAASASQLQLIEDQDARIRTIEKHLLTEKQLTSTLEEALVDLETQGKKAKDDLEAWKKKAWGYEDEIESLKKNQKNSRYSMQAVEEERNARRQAEAARAHLEERMNAINKKKKKSTLNCF
ncbi:MAG: hypothetical protein M1837_006275 [Sclerophora amabilis]|nr:MAG: hypothetical protein M1837_006275 [Sclerophora amabilis]